MNHTNPTSAAQQVLDYWLGDGLLRDWPTVDHNARWFGGGAAQDDQIRSRFGHLVDAALEGGLTEWEPSVETRLALIIVLDQFTRNVFRGQARAFEGDARAQRLAMQTISSRQHILLPRVGRVFLVMPLMHAEDHALQEECVAHFTYLVETSTPALRDALASHLRHAWEHRDIVRNFGRFPHRNAALGRTSTPEEDAFLTNGPRFGQ